MKAKIAIGFGVGFLVGFLVYAAISTRPDLSQHWRAVEAYLAYMRDPANAKTSYSNPPIEDPEPHLATLVAAGELKHVDLVLPTIPASNREAVQHWKTFCQQRPDGIVYTIANRSYVAFHPRGEPPLHLSIWFRESAQSEVQRLIRELEEMSTEGAANNSVEPTSALTGAPGSP